VSTTPVRAAVITGEHSYEVVEFHELFRGLEDVRAYIQHVDDFAASAPSVRENYDVVLFYGMPLITPSDEDQPWWAGTPRAAMEGLGRGEQGILLLHHGLLAYRDWPLWNGMVGIDDRRFSYHPNRLIRVDVTSVDHPITRGLDAWEMVDETYVMPEPDERSSVLLTTEHAKSMRSLAWTREHRKSRVFCFGCGHDKQAWRSEMFQEVLRRGILWCGGRLA
jgi:type 1 glutamine amidotransferase